MTLPAKTLLTLALAGGAATPALATTCAEFAAMDAEARGAAVAGLEPLADTPLDPPDDQSMKSRVLSLLQLCEPTPDADIAQVFGEVGR